MYNSLISWCFVLLDGGVHCDVLCLCVPRVQCKSGVRSGTGHAICKYRSLFNTLLACQQ